MQADEDGKSKKGLHPLILLYRRLEDIFYDNPPFKDEGMCLSNEQAGISIQRSTKEIVMAQAKRDDNLLKKLDLFKYSVTGVRKFQIDEKVKYQKWWKER